jgi:hypothetical protein
MESIALCMKGHDFREDRRQLLKMPFISSARSAPLSSHFSISSDLKNVIGQSDTSVPEQYRRANNGCSSKDAVALEALHNVLLPSNARGAMGSLP